MASLDLAAILPQGVWGRLAPIWNGKRRATLIAGAGLLAAILAVAILWSWDSPYSVLFAGLSGEEGGRALAELQKLSIPYRIAEGGRVILVPSAEVGRARLQLAARGVPKGDGAEWSLLDNERLGVSPFVEQVDYVRALETTLAHTIGRIDGVVSAQVRLALPRQTDFLASSPKPSASVMLSLRPGLQLSAAQVAGIAGLVAASVPGLAQDRVRVVDQSGRVLNPDRKDGLAQVPQQLAITREIEEGYKDSVTALLTPVLGRGNFRVAVTADLDFSKSKESAITYGNGHVLSQDESVRPALAGGAAIGIPGALSNEPPRTPVTAAPRTPTGRGRTPPSAQAQKPAPPPSPDKHQVTNYDIDRTVQVVEHPDWMLRALHVAVLVNPPAGQPMPAGRLKSIESLAQSVIGSGSNRHIAVVSLPFEPSAAAVGGAAISRWSAPWAAQAEHNAVLALAGLLVLFGGAFPILSRLRASAAAPSEAGAKTASGPPAGPPLLAGMPQGPRIRPVGLYDKPVIDAEALRVLAVNDPARTAQVIREWMARDRNRLRPAG
ncbi:MAG: flagellar basal-body MS-ring/collar protein FliF [Stellaceae bacterium]